MTLVLARTASAVLALLLLAEPSAVQAAAPLSVQAVEYKSDDIERAFDFRLNDRTLGDDLARADALERTVRFVNRVLRSGP